MEEEIITPEEEVFDYHKLRYILDKDGYVCHASLGGLIICDLGECTEYKGEVPSGYSTIEEWYDEEIEKLNAWKIVEGNLVFDNNKYKELQALCKKQEEENSCASHKWVKDRLKATSSVVTDELALEKTGTSLIVLDDAGNYEIPELKVESNSITNVEVISSNKNILGIEAITEKINGVNITINTNGTIKLNGTATNTIEFNLNGNNTNQEMLYLINKNTNYAISGLADNVSLSLYSYDGTDRVLVDNCTNGIANISSSFPITQTTLNIPSATTFNNVVISPQIEVGEATGFVKHEETRSSGTLYDNECYIDGLMSYENKTIIMIDKEVSSSIKYYTHKYLNEKFAEIEVNEKEIRSMVTNSIENFEKEFVTSKIASGEEIYIEDAGEYNLESLKVYGKSVQDETPTPDTPSEIESVGIYNEEKNIYEIEIETLGKNLLNNIATTQTINGVTFTVNSDKTITVNGTATAQIVLPITEEISINGTHILSGCPVGGSESTYELQLYGISGAVDYGNGKTISSGTVIARIVIRNEATLNNLVFKPQIEKGESLTEYQPYQKNELMIELNEPLRSLPNGVKDVAYIKNNILYVDRKIKSVVLDGNEDNWVFDSSHTTPTNRTVLKRSFQSGSKFYISNSFIIDSQTSDKLTLLFDANEMYMSLDNDLTGILTTDDNTTKIQKFKNWLSTHNTQVDYELEEPYTEKIGEIETLDTLGGYNHISLNAGIDTEMEINYLTNSVLNGQYATKSELVITENKIISSVSGTFATKEALETTKTTIEQTTNNISLEVSKKVNENEIISSINQSAEAVTINASKVNLTGYLTISSAENTYATQDGLNKGTTTINGACLTTGNIQSSNYVSGETGTKINLDDGTIDTKNFKVSSTGVITASNVDLSGKIKATSGSIAGWTIGTDRLYNGNNGIYADGQAYFYPSGGSIFGINNGVRLKGPDGIAIYNSYTSYGGSSSIEAGINIMADGGNLNLMSYSSTKSVNIRSYCSSNSVVSAGAGGIMLAAANNISLHSVAGKCYAKGNDLSNGLIKTDSGSASSRSVKENIVEFDTTEYEKALDLLEKIKIYNYDYKYNLYRDKHQYGFIIDDIEEVDDKFFKFTKDNAIVNGGEIDFNLDNKTEESEIVEVKKYDSDVLDKYLLTCIKALQNKIKELEGKI